MSRKARNLERRTLTSPRIFSHRRIAVALSLSALFLLAMPGGLSTIPPTVTLGGVVAPTPACMPGGPLAATYCPTDPTMNGAACLSYGVLVVETDLTGPGAIGNVVASASRSSAWTNEMMGAYAVGPMIAPPTPTMAHADAQQVGFSYAHPMTGLGVSSQTVFSRCDVASVTPSFGSPVSTQAYGRAGIEDAALSLGAALLLGAEVLDFEANAFGLSTGTAPFMACDVLQVSSVVTGIPTIARCVVPPNTALRVDGLPIADVTIRLNEEWGPVFAPGGLVWGGSVVHVQAVVPGVTQVDVHIGYVAVLVDGFDPVAPIVYVPNVGCTLVGMCA